MEVPALPPGPSPASTHPVTRLPNGSYLVQATYAATFSTWLGDLVDAPLKACAGTKVLDSVTKHCQSPPITVEPPVGIGKRPGAKRQARRPNDRKQLTQAGREALARQTNPHKKGVLWSGSVVWRLEYRCVGTTLCDEAPLHLRGSDRDGCACAVRVVYTATIEQVSRGLVEICVTGVNGASDAPPGGSLHSQHSPWDPAKLASGHAAELPSKQTAAKRAADALLKTQAQVIKQQRTMSAAQRSSGDASDGSPSGGTSRGADAAETGAAAVETSSAAELQARAVGQQAALRHAKINAKPRFSRQCEPPHQLSAVANVRECARVSTHLGRSTSRACRCSAGR